MQIGQWKFSIPWWGLLLYLVVGSAMLWLGNWQLDRAALKKLMQDRAAQSAALPAIDIENITDYGQAAENYQRLLLAGTYLHDRQLLWDNRTHRGIAGYEVITPLLLGSGVLALVNRGWIAPGPSREVLPDVSLDGELRNANISIEGFATVPSKGFASGPALATAGSNWPRVLQYLDFEAISEAYGTRVLPLLIEVQSVNSDHALQSVPSPRPEWLTGNWQPAASGPAKHYSYAFQWFAMALALTIITLVVNTKKHEALDG